jgi:hypothetical protein
VLCPRIAWEKSFLIRNSRRKERRAGTSDYINKINFAYAGIMYKPIPRATWNLGYNLTSSSGATPLLANPGTTTSPPRDFQANTATLSLRHDF